MDQINAAIAAAEAQAQNIQAAHAAETALVSSTGGGAVAPLDMGVAGFLKAGGINPDKWVTVKDTGLKLEKNEKAVIESFEGNINFANVKLFQGARGQLPGNKYEYIKTYDGRSESRSGQPWVIALNDLNARATAPANPYRGADIIVTLDKDVKQGGTTIPAGTKAGITTSVTGFSAFQSFLESLVQSGEVTVGADGQSLSGVVRTKVSHEAKSNADYEWGILVFEKA